MLGTQTCSGTTHLHGYTKLWCRLTSLLDRAVCQVENVSSLRALSPLGRSRRPGSGTYASREHYVRPARANSASAPTACTRRLRAQADWMRLTTPFCANRRTAPRDGRTVARARGAQKLRVRAPEEEDAHELQVAHERRRAGTEEERLARQAHERHGDAPLGAPLGGHGKKVSPPFFSCAHMDAAVARLLAGESGAAVLATLRGHYGSLQSLSNKVSLVRTRVLQALPSHHVDLDHLAPDPMLDAALDVAPDVVAAVAAEAGELNALPTRLAQVRRLDATLRSPRVPGHQAGAARPGFLPPQLADFSLDDDDRLALRESASAALQSKLEQLVEVVRGDAVLECCRRVLDEAIARPGEAEPARVCVCLLAVTGRRLTEIARTAAFEPCPDTTHAAHFSGQLKKRGAAEAYLVPLLALRNGGGRAGVGVRRRDRRRRGALQGSSRRFQGALPRHCVHSVVGSSARRAPSRPCSRVPRARRPRRVAPIRGGVCGVQRRVRGPSRLPPSGGGENPGKLKRTTKKDTQLPQKKPTR